jgi:EAL domain-containing protein (putative c-di-GMP-specific phosphodiesterase class I)/DNA-binding NarL/FixJ family response regulator
MSVAALRVMVVEDHAFERRMALRFLADLGVVDPLEADDGMQALELLRQHSERLDIIICDLDMPRMDGVAFLRNVAERKLANAVVVASGLDASLLHAVETMARAYGLHVLGKLEKPLSADKLQVMFAKYHELQPVHLRTAPQRFSRSELMDAVISKNFFPVYQPKIDLDHGRIVGAEALARWRHPKHGLIPPGAFMPAIERQGLLDELTDRMLAQACADRQAWAGAGLEIGIAVNISLLSLADVHAADRFHDIVRKTGCDPKCVTFEVTETAVMADIARALDVLARLRIKGFGLSIDDFGTGYSTLQQLGTIPFTELKIDQSFVRKAPEQQTLRSMLETILGLARKLKLREVAEGVETRAEWDLLRTLHCQQAQGYFMAPGMSGDALVPWAKSWTVPER